MGRRPRADGRAGRGAPRGKPVAPTPPPVLETPELVPGLKAWFDSRNATYFALGGGGEVSAWLSRGGSMSGIIWQQGTAANQPIRVVSEPLFGNMPALLFDGVNDSLITNSQAAWTFMHDGSGHSAFRVWRLDGTLVATHTLFASHGGSSTNTGFLLAFPTGSTQINIGKGVAPALVGANSSAGNHHARDVSRWHMIGHGAAVAHTRITGSSLTYADTSSPASTAAPSSIARLGVNAATLGSPLKGWILQDLYYDHVLTAGETTQLATWAATTYGVAA